MIRTKHHKRPSRHVRLVRTRRGKKRILINPFIKKRRSYSSWPVDYDQKEEKKSKDYYDVLEELGNIRSEYKRKREKLFEAKIPEVRENERARYTKMASRSALASAVNKQTREAMDLAAYIDYLKTHAANEITEEKRAAAPIQIELANSAKEIAKFNIRAENFKLKSKALKTQAQIEEARKQFRLMRRQYEQEQKVVEEVARKLKRNFGMDIKPFEFKDRGYAGFGGFSF